mgnify:FL=1
MSYEKLQKRCMMYKDLWLKEKKEKWAYLHEARRYEELYHKYKPKDTYEEMKKRMENEV